MVTHSIGKTIDQYLELLHKSFQLSWKHKELWIFGLFVSIVNTGSVFTVVVKSIRRIEPSEQLSADIVRQAIEGLPWLLQYLRNLVQQDTTRIILTVATIVSLFILLTIITFASQQLLITGLHRAEKRKKHLSFKKLFTELEHLHIWRLFAVNAITLITINILLIGASLPLSVLLSENILLNTLVYATFYLTLIPLSFAIDAIAMFTLINIVRREEGFVEAFSHSYHLLKKNWLTALELAILIYIINLLVPIIVFLGTALFAVFISIMAFASLSTGTIFIMTILTITSAIIVSFFLLAATGLIVTFNYSAWLHLMVKLEGKGIIPSIEHFGKGLIARIKQ